MRTVSPRVLTLPSPEVDTHVVQGPFSLPVELLIGEGRIGSQVRHISRTTRHNDIGQVPTNSLAESTDHLQDSVANSSSQVVGLALVVVAGLFPFDLLERSYMSIGTIDNMQVIAKDTCVRVSKRELDDESKHHAGLLSTQGIRL